MLWVLGLYPSGDHGHSPSSGGLGEMKAFPCVSTGSEFWYFMNPGRYCIAEILHLDFMFTVPARDVPK